MARIEIKKIQGVEIYFDDELEQFYSYEMRDENRNPLKFDKFSKCVKAVEKMLKTTPIRPFLICQTYHRMMGLDAVLIKGISADSKYLLGHSLKDSKAVRRLFIEEITKKKGSSLIQFLEVEEYDKWYQTFKKLDKEAGDKIRAIEKEVENFVASEFSEVPIEDYIQVILKSRLGAEDGE